VKLIFSPVRGNTPLLLSRSGDTLTVNGMALDFSGLPDGATLPATAIDCERIAGDVTRTDGVLTVPLLLPHGPIAPRSTRFPEPLTLTEDGQVDLPDWGELPPESTHAVIDGKPMTKAEYEIWEAAQ